MFVILLALFVEMLAWCHHDWKWRIGGGVPCPEDPNVIEAQNQNQMQFGPKNLTIEPLSCDRRETRRAKGTASIGTVKAAKRQRARAEYLIWSANS